MAKLLIAVLTLNEEANLPSCLETLEPTGARVIVVDSGSTDSTEAIAKDFGCEFLFHEFESIARQRNWVLDQFGKEFDWVLFLDADERLTPELARELRNLPEPTNSIAAFYIKREFWFMGHPLRHGPYSNNRILRLVHPPVSKIFEQTRTLEYTQVDGGVGDLNAPMIHENHRPLSDWIIKHDWYSTREAEDRKAFTHGSVKVTEHRMRAFIRRRIAPLIPPLAMPFVSFFYRYVIQVGFLDGRAGFIYYVLHDFWYPFLTAAKLIELEEQRLGSNRRS